MTRGVVLAACALLAQVHAAGQTPLIDDSPQLRIGVEARRDRLFYHFDNPSSIDTVFLVPHFFEQRYVADNVWLIVAARYTAGVRWETSGGLTPQRASTADDYDTFFDPGGPVIVSGTTGGAAIRSLRFSQQAEIGRLGGGNGAAYVRFLAGYRFRLDRSDFGTGHKTVTRDGTLVEAFDVTTREMASAQEHAFLWGAAATWILRGPWRLSASGDIAPVVLARLLVQLPDKYPGQDLVFIAKVAAGSARMALTRRLHEWETAVLTDAGTTWSYARTARLEHRTLGVQISFGRTWQH
jgi:hypothetical protein